MCSSDLRWQRPALAGAAAVVLIGGAVGGYAIATDGGGSGTQSVRIGPADATSKTFYGVQGGGLGIFDATTGVREGAVGGGQSEGTVAEVHLVGDTLYFTAGSARCASSLYAMAVGSATPQQVVTAHPGYGIDGFDVSPDGSHVTFFEGGCGGEAGQGALVFSDVTNGATKEIDFPSFPPVVASDPVWEADGVHVDAFVRTGMEGYLARYDSVAQSQDPAADTPSTNACARYEVDGGMPTAVTTAPDGSLWFAVQGGDSMQVMRCVDGSPAVEFTVSREGTPAAVAINAAGDVLLLDTAGQVWRWNGNGDPEPLAAASGISSATW